MKIQNSIFLIIIFQILSLNINAQTKGDSLIVFVGELISIEEVPNIIIRKEVLKNGEIREVEIPPFDYKYKSKFRIIQSINGFYSKDSIEFFSYSHYGTPEHYKYKHSLIFVSKYDNGELVQQKYTFFPVYKTKNGRWASDYSALDYRHPFSKDFTVKPETIEFIEELSFNTEGLSESGIEERFPKKIL